jgi:hypothetical protein
MVRILNMEGEEEMTPIPPLTTQQHQQLRNVLFAYTIWVIASITAYYFILPTEWQWIAYGPAIFVILAFLITGIAIFTRPMLSKTIDCVYVNHKRITCCQYCSMAEINDNIVNNSFPVVKCRETAKVCYAPMKIPRWCPHAKN